MRTTRTRTRSLAALVPLVALLASACGSGTPAVSIVPVAGFTPDATLLAAAQKEGTLNVIALPPDWCNYGPMITPFAGATGLKVNSSSPTPVPATRSRPSTPTRPTPARRRRTSSTSAISFGAQAVQQGLLQAYKVEHLEHDRSQDRRPERHLVRRLLRRPLLRRQHGRRSRTCPQDWSDLLKPEYAHRSPWPATRQPPTRPSSRSRRPPSATAGSLDNAQAGLDFFKKLQQRRQLRADRRLARAPSPPARRPILITWNYLAQSYSDALKGNPAIAVVIPKTGRFGGMYVQGISAYAPHPECRQAVGGVPVLRRRPDQLAEGLLLHHPLRGPGHAQRHPRRPRGQAAGCTPARSSRRADQLTAAKKLITENW